MKKRVREEDKGREMAVEEEALEEGTTASSVKMKKRAREEEKGREMAVEEEALEEGTTASSVSSHSEEVFETSSIPCCEELPSRSKGVKQGRWILIKSIMDADDITELSDYAWTQAHLACGLVKWCGTNWVLRKKDDGDLKYAWTIVYGSNPIKLDPFRKLYKQGSRSEDRIQAIPRSDVQQNIRNLFLLRKTLVCRGSSSTVPYIKKLSVSSIQCP